jgi:F0F1-type ATP synthase membrane subunit a
MIEKWEGFFMYASMNIKLCLSKCVVEGIPVICRTVFLTLIVLSFTMLPIGLGLHLSGNTFGATSLLLIAIGSVPWGILTLFGCINGCQYICNAAQSTVDKHTASVTAEPTAIAQAPTATGQGRTEDPVENV